MALKARARRIAPPPRPTYAVTPERYAHGNIEIGDRPDLDRPMRVAGGTQMGYHEVRGARVRSGHAFLFSRGSITQEQFEAADRYVLVVEKFTGARERALEAAGRVPGFQQGSPTVAQVEAAGDLRRANAGMGKIGTTIVDAVCLHGSTMAMLAETFREDERSVLGRLRAALDRLGEIWG